MSTAPAVLDHGRLGKLIRLLASPNDGEVVATVRAIGRTLGASGRDFHDLAAVLQPGTMRASPPVKATSPEPDAPPKWNSLFRSEQLGWLDLLRVSERATKVEIGIVEEVCGRIYRQPHLAPHPRERTVLNRLIAREWAAGVRP